MKITVSQLRRIIKEEVQRSFLEHDKDYLVGDEKMRSYKEQPDAPMPVGESRNRKAKNLAEGHARITEEEFAAWKRGDWGFVSEGLEGMKEMTGEEAAAFIASKDPKEIVDQDIIDVDSGEIYAVKGKTYGSSYLHPNKTPRKMPLRLSDYFEDEDNDVDVQGEFQAALQKFGEGWKDYDASDMSPEEVAPDAALSFFHMYPQWKTWATALGMTKADVQSAAADAALEGMLSR